MARKTLMLLPLCLLVMGNRGCETLRTEDVFVQAKKTEAVAAAPISLPASLPAACTAKTGRVRPSLSEPRVVTIKRWEVVAEHRDRQSVDCGRWWDDYRTAVEGRGRH